MGFSESTGKLFEADITFVSMTSIVFATDWQKNLGASPVDTTTIFIFLSYDLKNNITNIRISILETYEKSL